MVDNLSINKIHVGGIAGLDLLPAQNPVSLLAKNYLIACKVEGKSPKTLETYSMVVRSLLEFSEELSANHIRMFLLSLQERKLKASTVRIYYRSLKTFCTWLINEGIISEHPMQNIKPPIVPELIIKPFSQEDIQNLLLLCSGNSFLDLRNRAIILLFLDTGLRLAELTNIQLQDINFSSETIRVMGKGSRERVVRMGTKTQKAILRYLLMRTDSHDCLWVTEERRPMKRDGIQTTIERLCKRAEITDARPGVHTFRHTFGTRSLINGAGIREVQSLLGHSTLKTTLRYVATVNSEEAVKRHKQFSPVDRLGIK